MKLTDKQVCDIGFAVLRAHNDDRLWRALTYNSGPYDVTMPALPLLDLGQAFYDAGRAAAAPQPEVRALPALTDEQIADLWSPHPGGDVRRPILGLNKVLAFARAVERLHGIGAPKGGA